MLAYPVTNLEIPRNTQTHFLPVSLQSENTEDSVWFDVGVFKTLFCEVTNYFLPSEGGDLASILSGQNPADSKVCPQLHPSVKPTECVCLSIVYLCSVLIVEAARSS